MKNDMIIDCFAGGGGASVGIEMALGRQVSVAINHDPEAIRMHKVNHPGAIHLTEDIFSVNMPEIVKGQKVPLMWASPDCTSHSKAKGGQPRNKGLRILPWAVFKHCKSLAESESGAPSVVIMENVEEIQDWGPLDDKGFPVKERKGEFYNQFISAMKRLGYAFESRELVAADYGAPTSRRRWYAIFRNDGTPIVWPDPTHDRNGEHGLMRWKAAGDYIDWSNLGRSIFDRKKELAPSTQKRIAEGIKKYILENPDPYIVEGKDISSANHPDKVAAFITKYYKTGIGQSLKEPLHTITTSPGHFGLVTAFLIKYYGMGCGQKLDQPLGTITTKDRFGLVTVEIDGETYQIVDIRLRMLLPEELKIMQGFPEDYIIDHDADWKAYPVSEQVARIGNSVSPPVAKALVSANCASLKVGERTVNHSEYYEQMRLFA